MAGKIKFVFYFARINWYVFLRVSLVQFIFSCSFRHALKHLAWKVMTSQVVEEPWSLQGQFWPVWGGLRVNGLNNYDEYNDRWEKSLILGAKFVLYWVFTFTIYLPPSIWWFLKKFRILNLIWCQHKNSPYWFLFPFTVLVGRIWLQLRQFPD